MLTLVFALLFSTTAFAVSRPAHFRLWLCIHAHEQSAWNDSNPPYWGGLQMGAWFVGHYAHPSGTPGQWSPLAQMWVAENAYRREHYSVAWLRGQWPTSRGCV